MPGAPSHSLSPFQRLCQLEGTWKDDQSVTTVAYRKSANGSVLVETWRWPDKGIEALTLYHLDENDLIATHYCPVGNQPRLTFTPGDKADRFAFHFVSATNLPDKNVDHCESFWIEINSADRFTRSETYSENGRSNTQQSTYQRMLTVPG